MVNQRVDDAAGATSREFAGGQKVFGRYTLAKIIGRGGMGIIWLARDEELERNVALKFLPDLMIQDRAVFDQLKRETKHSLELTHPHIVRIYDFIHDERAGCISMEYIDGETLSTLRSDKEQKAFQPDEIATWTSQLCDALDYAHNHARIIHRDLKPANLMVNHEGDLKVSDFGIARSLGDSMSRLTTEQGRSGTLVYMSPQQLGGEHGTHLDDIYSLGATLYELLTSKPPFYSGNIDRQINERVAPSMTERRKELDIEPALVPQVWEDAIAACLAKDPARRPQSAAEVTHRLQLVGARTRTTKAAGKSSNRKLLLFGGLATLSILMLAGLHFGVLKRQTKAISQSVAIPEKSIAVMPFENRSRDPDNAYFADGIQDEIVTRLSKIADLKVISRTSTEPYKSVTKNLRDIARQLGVANIVEGSVQKNGDEVRINVQLINASTDYHLWADTIDRKLTDIFVVESDVAKAIADQLKAQISPDEKISMEKAPTSNLDAHDLYLRAQTLWGETSVPALARKKLWQATELLDEAVARDPNFFLAWCLLSRTHGAIYRLGYDHTEARLNLAKLAGDKALHLRPDAGEAHLALAYYYYYGFRDYDNALSHLAIARQTLPNSAEAFEYTGLIERRLGRWNEATENLEHAVELDPRNPFVLQQLALTYAPQHRYADEIRVWDRLLIIIPDDPATQMAKAKALLHWRGDIQPARSTFASFLARNSTIPSQAGDPFFALYERNHSLTQSALANYPVGGVSTDGVNVPKSYWEGVVARCEAKPDEAKPAFLRARTEMTKILDEQGNFAPALSFLGLIDACLGRKEDALREGRRACELLPISADAVDGADLAVNLALIYAWVGEKKFAIDQINFVQRSPNLLSYGMLKLHPFWDPLRGDRDFENVVASLAPH